MHPEIQHEQASEDLMVHPKKVKFVQDIAAQVQHSPIIGVINMENLPAGQLQRMRSTLTKKGVLIAVGRKRLLQRALQQVKRDHLEALQEKMEGVPALLFSKENPFSLYALLQKSKSPASAKPGQKAPRDLVVKAGPTNFAPGPIISELAAVGIKTKVEQGKLSILQDTVIVKEGQVISQKVSDTLKRMDIKPMEIGLNLVAVWENGFVFSAKQLHIDEVAFAQDIAKAVQGALNLALEAAYPTSETVSALLQKAFRESKALALEQHILSEETIAEILAQAERQAAALQALTP